VGAHNEYRRQHDDADELVARRFWFITTGRPADMPLAANACGAVARAIAKGDA